MLYKFIGFQYEVHLRSPGTVNVSSSHAIISGKSSMPTEVPQEPI